VQYRLVNLVPDMPVLVRQHNRGREDHTESGHILGGEWRLDMIMTARL